MIGGRVDTDALLDVAMTAAAHAGDLLLGYARRLGDGDDLGVRSKTSVTDMVSDADRGAERLIAACLAAARPDDGLLSEEGEVSHGGTSGLRWVVDPLDGTTNFLYGQPHWCVSIACEDDLGALVGVVHDPLRAETFRAVRGDGSRLGEAVLGVTGVKELEQTLLATGFSYDPAMRSAWALDLADLLHSVRDIRRPGSAALDLAWCAAGRLDAYLECGIAPWDWAAGCLLVTEAGGYVSWPQRRLAERERLGVLAAGPAVHDALARWLEQRG